MTNPATIRSALAIAVTANLPVLMWGLPGSGKTSMVIALAKQLSVPIEVVVGSIREPSDFAGLPVVTEHGTRFAPPQWAERLAQASHGIVFLDELTTASPAVQAAMLRVVLEKAVGDLQLPQQVRIVAAANPPSIAADGWDLSAPLANRLLHLHWEVSAIDIAQGFSEGFPVSATTELRPATQAEIGVAKAHIGAFLRLRPELVSVLPKSLEQAGRAWPSPRSWEMAAIAIATSRANKAEAATQAALVLGAVGQAAGFEVLNWLNNLDLPDPVTLLADPTVPLPKRPDRLYAALGSVTAFVIADGSTQMWEQAWDVISQVAVTTPDVAAAAARTLVAHRPKGAMPPMVLGSLQPILKDAGLLP